MVFSSVIFGFLIGFLPGLMGGGGSIMAVPVFVYIMKFEVKTAVCMSLVVVGITSFVGAIRYWKLNLIRFRIVFTFGSMAMLAAYVGAQMAALLTDTLQMTLFAITVLGAAYFMFTGKTQADNSHKSSILILLASGIMVGTLSGLVGVGGGFLIVPTLVLFAKLPIKSAVGTSLAIMSMNATAGVLGYIDKVTISWNETLLFTLFATVGIFASTYLIKFISSQHLKKAFAAFIFIMGLVIFVTNL